MDYLAPSNEISGLDKLKSIEKVLEFLISFKEIQKNNNNKKYYIIQKQIDWFISLGKAMDNKIADKSFDVEKYINEFL